MSRKSIERILAVLSLCILIAAWVAGGVRSDEAGLERIKNISADIEGVKQVRPSVYEGHRTGEPDDKLYIGLAEHPSYGGPLQVAVVVNRDEIIERVALVQSTDTSTYITRVLGDGVLDAFLGASSSNLPHVDAVSGATLSSNAMRKGVEKAVDYIRGSAVEESTVQLSNEEMSKAALSTLFFLLAFVISSHFFKWNKKYARLGLLGVCTIVLGFMYGAQFSLASLVLFLSGLWTKGMASYTALICLVLALVIFLATRKNLYCAMLCPFGGVQEGLGRITGCSAPKKTEWMKWTARGFTLFAMSAAVYFRNPSDAQFEPFGMAFSFIGSTAIFALTVLIVVTSLVIKRPWCTLLCPIGSLFEYLTFMRTWLVPSKKRKAEQ
ncbi:4Fe-4S binding protein [Halodesulfovibrio marinisediminis]|uniref:4Fe-4S binding domain-containing protein n=1 Tax=Halodesulfovibrio marinisediminis DSM 17456 TaxID=1121457 RepID=A0A1N6E9R7_9BACT|nr:4Fe-4S binding protein [Halodesulfovibrio marinisediminis]SIN79701.1 4Fe-4S binding domain-containing protein [Halodesulfovibrio marinisediminis DSM 17456]